MIAAQIGPERVRASVAEVLARPEFLPPEPSPAERLVEAIGRFLRTVFGGLGLGDEVVPGILAVLLVLCAAVLLFVGVRALARLASGTREGEPGRAARAEAARANLVAARLVEARDAARRGDHVAALRAYFVALVIGLSERGDLEYRDSWTNRELFERGRPRSDAAHELARWVPELDRKSFGSEPATARDVERLAASCERLLGAPAAAAEAAR